MSGYIAGFVALLCLSAVFSAGESAYTQANRLRIESALEDGKRSAKTALRLLDRLDDTVDAILLGNSLLQGRHRLGRHIPADEERPSGLGQCAQHLVFLRPDAVVV